MKKIMLGFALAALAGSAFADSTAWFDAGIKDYDAWPGFTEPVEGSWSGTSAATLEGTKGSDQHLKLTASSTALVFEAFDSKSLAAVKPTISSSVIFTAFDLDDKPTIPDDAKGGVIVCEDSDGALTYWGVAKVDSANAWVQLDGTPSLETAVTVSITLNGSKVTYQIGSGAAATYDIVLGDEPVLQKTSYQGIGSVYTLVGSTEPMMKTLTIGAGLASDNLKVVSVEGATKVDDTTYTFAYGADVTVTFGAVKDAYMWRTDSTSKTYSEVSADLTINARPEGVNVAYAGTSADPIMIYSYADFVKIQADGTNYSGVCFKQSGNIGFAGTEPWISTNYTFSGTYDGDDYQIQNVTFGRGKYNGLFGTLNGTIKNLTVDFDGVAAGEAEYSVALVGKIGSASAVFDSVTTEGTLSGCAYKCAGFAVQGHRGTFTNCVNKVNVSGVGDRLAGFVCFSNSDTDLYFVDCVNEGNITVTSTFVPEAAGDVAYGCGGFLGMCGNNNKRIHLTRCTNTGTISKSDGVTAMLGAFIGQAGSNTPKDTSGATTNYDYVVAVDCVARSACQPIGAISTKLYAKTTVTGLNFATLETVEEVEYANYCTPTAAGTFAMMMSNAEDIELTGVAKGDTLTLTPKFDSVYSGTVTCNQGGLEMTQSGNTWTAVLKTFKITYVYMDEDKNPVTDVENSNPTSFTVESGTIVFDKTKVSKTGYTLGDEPFNPEEIECEVSASDQNVEVTLIKNAPAGTEFTITATGCTALKVNDQTVDSPYETEKLSAGDTIKIEITYDTATIKLPVKKITISGGTPFDLPSNPYTYTVSGEETSPTILVTVEDASESEEVTPKDVVPAGTDADKQEAAEDNITVLATKSGKTDKTLLQSIAGWVGTKGISGNDIAEADAEDLEAAYLLNCGDLKEATIEQAKAAFSFPSITPGTKPTVTTPDGFHGTLTTWGNPGLDASGWVDLKDKSDMSQYKFYKAELTK